MRIRSITQLLGWLGLTAIAAGAPVNAAELKIAGNIQPEACILTVDGSQFTLPETSFDALDPDRAVALEEITLSADVECSTATQFGLQFSDTAKVNSPYNDIFYLYSAADPAKDLGWYEVHLVNGVSDGTNRRFGRRPLSGGVTQLGSRVLSRDPDHAMVLVGASDMKGTKVGSFDISIHPSLSSRSSFDAGDEAQLVGEMTIELRYL